METLDNAKKLVSRGHRRTSHAPLLFTLSAMVIWGCSGPTPEEVRAEAKANLFELLRFGGRTLDDPENRRRINGATLRLYQLYAERASLDLFAGESILPHVETLIERLTPTIDKVLDSESAIGDIDDGQRFEVRADALCEIIAGQGDRQCAKWEEHSWTIDATVDGDRVDLKINIGELVAGELSIAPGHLRLVLPFPRRKVVRGYGKSPSSVYRGATNAVRNWLEDVSEAAKRGETVDVDNVGRITVDLRRAGETLSVDLSVGDAWLLYSRNDVEYRRDQFSATFGEATAHAEIGAGQLLVRLGGRWQLERHHGTWSYLVGGDFAAAELRSTKDGVVDATAELAPETPFDAQLKNGKKLKIYPAEPWAAILSRADETHALITATRGTKARLLYEPKPAEEMQIDVSWAERSSVVLLPERRDSLLLLHKGGTELRHRSDTIKLAPTQCLRLDFADEPEKLGGSNVAGSKDEWTFGNVHADAC